MKKKFIDLTGKRIGVLLVLKYLGVVGKHSKYLCRCDCGNFCDVWATTLISGKHQQLCTCARRKKYRYDPNDTSISAFKQIYRYLVCHKRQNSKELSVSPLDIKHVFDKQNGKCPYSGLSLILPSYKIINKNIINIASIDRIDSSIGYHIDNIQFVSRIANFAKNDLKNEDFINWCDTVAKFRALKLPKISALINKWKSEGKTDIINELLEALK